MNLAVNARDAMPRRRACSRSRPANVELVGRADGTTLRGAEAGHYVVLASPTPAPASTRRRAAHIFEPFFTTKEPGKGTGPRAGDGLRHRQAERRLHPASTASPATGAAFEIYLPRTRARRSAAAVEEQRPRPRPREDSILLVEDEEVVRELVAEMLELDGYTRAAWRRTRRRRSTSGRPTGPFDAARSRPRDARNERPRAARRRIAQTAPTCACCSSPATAARPYRPSSARTQVRCSRNRSRASSCGTRSGRCCRGGASRAASA